MITTETRKEIAQAIAKCIAYKNCGKQDAVDYWALRLLNLLECHDLIDNLSEDFAERQYFKSHPELNP